MIIAFIPARGGSKRIPNKKHPVLRRQTHPRLFHPHGPRSFRPSCATKASAHRCSIFPVHLQPWYRQNYGYALRKCPMAENYYCRALSLPLFPAMTDSDVASVVRSVTEVVAKRGPASA
jgi:hypothetical protein